MTCGRKYGPKLENLVKKRENKSGRMRSQNSTTLVNGEHLLYRSGGQRVQRNHQNARSKLEVPMDEAMRCKKSTQHTSSVRETAARLEASNKVPKTKYVFIVESHESTRQPVEPSLPQFQEDHIAGKGVNSMSHHSLVHKFIPMPQVAKIPDAKGAVENVLNKLETISAWQLKKVKSKREVGHPRGTKRPKESPLCYIDGHMSSPEFRDGTKVSEVQRSSRAPRWHGERRLWSLCSF